MGLLEKAREYRRQWEEDKSKEVSKETESYADKLSIEDALEKKNIDIATLFEIAQELNSTLKLKELFDVIILTCMGHLATNTVAIMVSDTHGNYKIKAHRGIDGKPTSVKVKKKSPLIDFFLTNPSPYTIKELGDFDDLHKDIKQFLKFHIELIVPLVHKKEFVGMLCLGDRMMGEYGNDEKRFANILGSLSAIAINNAKLYEDLKKTNRSLDRKLNELSAIYDVCRVINTSMSTGEVLKLVIETLQTGFKVKKGIILLKDNIGNLVPKAWIGFSDSVAKKIKFSYKNELFSGIMELGEAINIDNFKEEDSISARFSKSEIAKLKTFFVIPLIANEKRLGLMIINEVKGERKKTLSDDTQKLFSIISALISPSILAAKILEEEKKRITDPYIPFVDKLNAEIELADEYGVSFSISLLEIDSAATLFEKDKKLFNKNLNTLINTLAKLQNEFVSVVRLALGKFALLCRNKDVDDRINFEKQVLKMVSKTKGKGSFKYTIRGFSYPDEFGSIDDIIAVFA